MIHTANALVRMPQMVLKTSDKSHTRAEIFSSHGYIFLQIFPIFMHLSKTVEMNFKNKYAEKVIKFFSRKGVGMCTGAHKGGQK